MGNSTISMVIFNRAVFNIGLVVSTHLEKYESQWEGLSHILLNMKNMFQTTNQFLSWWLLWPWLKCSKWIKMIKWTMMLEWIMTIWTLMYIYIYYNYGILWIMMDVLRLLYDDMRCSAPGTGEGTGTQSPTVLPLQDSPWERYAGASWSII